jgi:methanol corrinoid protein
MKPFTLGVLLGRLYRENPDAVLQAFESTVEVSEEEVEVGELDALLPEEEPFRGMAKAVAEGDVELTVKLVEEALQNGIDALEIATEGLTSGIEAISELYNRRLAYVPEILLADRALQAGIEKCGDALAELERRGVVLAHTAEGDIHDIGKNIVASIVEASGYQVVDLGTSVESASVVEAVKRYKPVAIIGSSLMTTTRTAFYTTSDLLREEHLSPVFIVGGGACDEEFAMQKDLLVYARNPVEVVQILELAEQGLDWRGVREHAASLSRRRGR